MAGALDGIRVIDITTILLGPYGTQLLGDMGADVIKVEAPPKGDSTRHLGRNRSPGMGGPFLNMNRNKRSICLDLKQEPAKQALRKLIETADVLVHNMRPQAIARLGFAYDDVAAIKPDIVYCGCYGFSQDGPYADRPAYDDLIQAACGMVDIFRSTAGRPLFAPTVMADKTTGLMMSQAIAMALFHRERTGEGQFVEVPMFETLVSFLMVEHIYEHAFDPPIGPLGYARITTPHRRPHESKDGYVCVLPYTDKQWTSFFEIAGRPETMADPRFANHTTRNEHIEEIYAMMGEIVREKTTDEWVAACHEAQIPVSPVLSLQDVFDNEHARAVDLFQKHEHPTEGDIVITKPPVTMSKSPASIRRQAPRLGQNGAEVLRELGYSADDVAALKASGALQSED